MINSPSKSFYDIESYGSHLRAIRKEDIKSKDSLALKFLDQELSNIASVQSLIIEDAIFESYRAGKLDDAEKRILYRISLDPKDPLSWMSLAKHYAVYRNDLAKAKKYIDKSISLAKINGRFYINLNIDSMVIYAKAGDVKSIEKSIRRILNYRSNSYQIDSGYDINFVKKLAALGVSRDLIEEYDKKFSK